MDMLLGTIIKDDQRPNSYIYIYIYIYMYIYIYIYIYIMYIWNTHTKCEAGSSRFFLLLLLHTIHQAAFAALKTRSSSKAQDAHVSLLYVSGYTTLYISLTTELIAGLWSLACNYPARSHSNWTYTACFASLLHDLLGSKVVLEVEDVRGGYGNHSDYLPYAAPPRTCSLSIKYLHA